ncbi:Gfo/Idh/MocA family protein [Yinghuangia seranimata]|uniref:Gfo/Idh/MocA family protein n=1 Tax=Yinghuangia seranimata TaxID=408067 RepID=UPI00248AE206|nr:Gfo/Idh/MocA family oxidoreductase [Yinghuangia seranimata]MDI2130063.1 Gfo/Idh/MocA family oxidoreductase [Yinghuangia seranimata]
MTDPLRVGLLGLGHIAQTHLAVLAAREDVTLDFTVDPHVPEGPSFRGEQAPHHRSLADALDKHDPDLMVIATPVPTHVDLAAEALTRTGARVLVEKPIVHDLAALDRLRAMDEDGVAAVGERLCTAHHFAFSPEVRWAEETIARYPEWGPVTQITSAFNDPFVLRGPEVFETYVSSWMDGGVNQLSLLARFVDFTELLGGEELDGRASAWYTFAFDSRGHRGTARLRTNWLTGASSKESVLVFAESGVELWIDHTAMTGFAARGRELLERFGTDGRTPRIIAHYQPLYASLLSDAPDPILSFDTAARITRLHRGSAPGPG